VDSKTILAKLKFDDRGLIPAIVQDVATGRVLSLAYMNRESLELSLREQQTYFWSRSRGRLWHKGETSGNTQRIERLEADCDGDALLVSVKPDGPACHTGQVSCFFEELFEPVSVSAPNDADPSGKRQFLGTVDQLLQVIKSRKAEMPEGSYTTYLFAKGLDKILKKIGEESAETIIAAKNRSKSELTMESADLLYHLLVLFVNEGLEIEEVLGELEKRAQRNVKKHDQ
jgi:phosphoribosyl-AMP cyclohydrolase / phosphoribosyl-ATP pyrophosphohydrolase